MTPPRQNAFDRFRVIEKIALKIGESIQTGRLGQLH